MEPTNVKCPRCGEPCEASGVATDERGGTLTIFQCDHCVDRRRLAGLDVDVAFTFALDPDGTLVDVPDPFADC